MRNAALCAEVNRDDASNCSKSPYRVSDPPTFSAVVSRSDVHNRQLCWVAPHNRTTSAASASSPRTRTTTGRKALNATSDRSPSASNPAGTRGTKSAMYIWVTTSNDLSPNVVDKAERWPAQIVHSAVMSPDSPKTCESPGSAATASRSA